MAELVGISGLLLIFLTVMLGSGVWIAGVAVICLSSGLVVSARLYIRQDR